VPRPGPQNGRFASEPLGGLTSLTGTPRELDANASVALAEALGDTVARITEQAPLPRAAMGGGRKTPRIDESRESMPAPEVVPRRPQRLDAPAGGQADDLKLIKGVGPDLETLLHGLGVFHFRQIADWSPEEAAWVDANIGAFRGQVIRDGWVAQAAALGEEDGTAHAQNKVSKD
jgi:NADH-quinone oxidoreductase subunit E